MKISPVIIKIISLLMIWTLAYAINLLITDIFLKIMLSVIPIYTSYKVIKTQSIQPAEGSDVARMLMFFFTFLFIISIILALTGH